MAFQTAKEAWDDVARRETEREAKAPTTHKGYLPPDPAHLAKVKQQLHERWNEHERARNARRPISYDSHGSPAGPAPAQ